MPTMGALGRFVNTKHQFGQHQVPQPIMARGKGDWLRSPQGAGACPLFPGKRAPLVPELEADRPMTVSPNSLRRTRRGFAPHENDSRTVGLRQLNLDAGGHEGSPVPHDRPVAIGELENVALIGG